MIKILKKECDRINNEISILKENKLKLVDELENLFLDFHYNILNENYDQKIYVEGLMIETRKKIEKLDGDLDVEYRLLKEANEKILSNITDPFR
jgi:uncharacterized coiled-coil DUF342 family protein